MDDPYRLGRVPRPFSARPHRTMRGGAEAVGDKVGAARIVRRQRHRAPHVLVALEEGRLRPGKRNAGITDLSPAAQDKVGARALDLVGRARWGGLGALSGDDAVALAAHPALHLAIVAREHDGPHEAPARILIEEGRANAAMRDAALVLLDKTPDDEVVRHDRLVLGRDELGRRAPVVGASAALVR